MNRIAAASVWARVAGVLVVLLALVHNSGVVSVYRGYGFDRLPSLSGRGFIYMFLGVGFAWIFAGLLLFASGRGLATGASWAWPLGLATAVLMLVFGIGAMIVMPDNPPAPLILGSSILAVIPFLMGRPTSR